MTRGRLVLASASPRRRELLGAAGVRFEIRPADVDEGLDPAWAPREAARALAERKARAVAGGMSGPIWVLGADTLVVLPSATGGPHGSLLGKPVGPEEATRMLRSLSATRHCVVTGLCVVCAADARALVDDECTWVTMRAITPAEVDAYVASGEWRDKAGGYAIQESADRFVTALEGGGFDNVVGLPVARALALLRRAGALEGVPRLAGEGPAG